MSSDATADFDDYRPPDPRPQIAGYEVGGEIGRGGLSIVYSARQLSLNRMVAVRVAYDARLDAQLDAEARTIVRLRHPHIIQLYDLLEYGFPPRPCLIMELIPGGNLQDRLAHQPQEPRVTAMLMAHVANTVHAVHEAGYVHLNLKPRKVLLDRGPDLAPDNGVPLLTEADFGIPRLSGFELAMEVDRANYIDDGRIMGTPVFMAPEQARGDWQRIGPATDIYALGVMLYEMLTGRVPFRGNSMVERFERIMNAAPTPIRQIRRDVDRQLDAIVLRCLEKSTDRRFSTALELADELRSYARD